MQKPGPPVYIGAFSSKGMLRLAGEVAEGWYPGSQNTVEAFREKVELVRDAARKSNRPSDEVDIIASIPTIVSTDEKERTRLLSEIEQSLKTTLVLSQYMLDMIGVGRDMLGKSLPKELDYQFATPGPIYDKALTDAVNRLEIPDAVLQKAIDSFIAFGSVDDCVSKIEKFVRAGATQIFFANFVASKQNYEKIGKEIIPRLSRD